MFKTNKRSVYISPQKPSDIIPLLGEALLLYDVVALDVSLSPITFNVLAKKIDPKTMEYLIDSNSLHFVYDEFGPVIATQPNSNIKTILFIIYDKSGIPPVDIEKLKESLKPIYPRSLINKIITSLKPSGIDRNLLLNNCYNDINNIFYISNIFNYVKEQFNLPDFTLEIYETGCSIISHTGDKQLSERIDNEWSYGLNLIAEINQRMSMLTSYDEIVCESELQKFLLNKYKYQYKYDLYGYNCENFMELCEIHDFPDIKELLSVDLISISEIVKLRNGNGQVMRYWLNSVTRKCLEQSVQFSKEYAKILTHSFKGLPIHARTVTFGFLQTLSYFKPIEGAMLSAVNEFLLPKVVNGWQPRLFFDKAKKLCLKDKEPKSRYVK